MLRVSDIYKSFGPDSHPLQGVNLEILSKESVSIMGRSGSGKSTLLNCIAGIENPDKGDVFINNKLIDYSNEKSLDYLRSIDVGIVFQKFHLLPRASVYHQISLTTQASDEQIDEILSALNILELKHKKVENCSGGQQQRISIARALVKKPKLVLADEPTANLDASLAIKSVELMVGLAKELGSAFLIITHDDRITPYVDRVQKLEEGKLI